MHEDIEGFTDLFDDDFFQASQPMSLSSTPCPSTCLPEFPASDQNPAKYTGQYGQFRSVQEINPKYRDVFSFPYFNLIQSKIIDDALYSDKSIVVCAPTGSGKTVVFEMAIVQLLMELEENNYTGDFKIVYMAPVKALCTERLSEWYPKFIQLGLLCIEVTGDTDVDFSQLKPYKIIITTPEKWDMLTRRWKEFRSLVEVVRLFLIDEVHILNDETRGPVLEAVVSRMKTIEDSMKAAHRVAQVQQTLQTNRDGASSSSIPPAIRFVAVSATISNPDDVAKWLSAPDKPAVFYKLGEECRPVKLKRVVEGYHCPEGTGIFKFDLMLNYKLWPIIEKYYNGKPTLIFCSTRKSVMMTAETLSRELTIQFTGNQRQRLAAIASTIKNKKLQALVSNGVGCHHAGLLYEERLKVEQAFRQRDLPILVTTTTLAMGVNLPAHLVIVKCTQQYVNGQYQEYSVSTILQMIGRAGRPQFDTEATAVIMTRQQDKARYCTLVEGSGPLESALHKRLAEHLNSEVALRTVQDIAQGVQWARSTFLHVRAGKDPRKYLALPPAATPELISQRIQDLCMKAMNGLASAGLITMDQACCVSSTDAGRMMSIYCLDFETMKLIMKIEGGESLQELLALICESHELAGLQLRADERRTLNTLNRNNCAPTIRYPMKGKISTKPMKFNCVIQAVFGCLQIPDPSLHQESMKLLRTADRICKSMVAYITREDFLKQCPPYFEAIVNAITLAKCCVAHLWEDSPYVSRQLRGIGPALSTMLVSAGKTNFMLIEESHPRDLERIMNKNAPAGNMLRKQVGLLPKYQLSTEHLDNCKVLIALTILNAAQMAECKDELTAGENHRSYILAGDSENCILLCTSFKDKDLIMSQNASKTFSLTRKHNFEHTIKVICISSSFVGLDVVSIITLPAVYPEENKYYDDIQTITQPNNNLPSSKVKPKEQATITCTFKERKRRINETDQEVIAKKRKDCSMIEKFKSLKQSFDIENETRKEKLQTSNQLFKNEYLNADPRNKVNLLFVDDVGNEKCVTPCETFIENHSTDQLNQIIHAIPDTENNLNTVAKTNLSIDNLLQDIEKEMKSVYGSNKSVTVVNENTFDNSKSACDNYNVNYTTTANTIDLDTCSNTTGPTDILRNKRVKLAKDTITRKSTSIDPYIKHSLLHKNMASSDDDECPKKDGFNEKIRSLLCNFLQNETCKAQVRKPNQINIPVALINDDFCKCKMPIDFNPSGHDNIVIEERISNKLNDDNCATITKLPIICEKETVSELTVLNTVKDINDVSDDSTRDSKANYSTTSNLANFENHRHSESKNEPYLPLNNVFFNKIYESKVKSDSALILTDNMVQLNDDLIVSNTVSRNNETENLSMKNVINCEYTSSKALYALKGEVRRNKGKIKINKITSFIQTKAFRYHNTIPDRSNYIKSSRVKDVTTCTQHDNNKFSAQENSNSRNNLNCNQNQDPQPNVQIENNFLNLQVQTDNVTEKNIDVTNVGALEVRTKNNDYSKAGKILGSQQCFITASEVLKETVANQSFLPDSRYSNCYPTPSAILEKKDSARQLPNTSENKFLMMQKPSININLKQRLDKDNIVKGRNNVEISACTITDPCPRSVTVLRNEIMETIKEEEVPKSVETILQKYAYSIRQERCKEHDSLNASLGPVYHKMEDKSDMMAINKRYVKSQNKYKIQDIDDVAINLPLLLELKKNSSQTVDNTLSYINTRTVVNENYESFANSETQIEQINCPSDEDFVTSNEENYTDLELHLFNPKCLLASYQNDNKSNFVLPPPSEFSDETEQNYVNKLFEHDDSYDSYNEIRICSETPRPSKGFETWIFSYNDQKDDYNFLSNAYEANAVSNTSCNRLNVFKFPDKEKLHSHRKQESTIPSLDSHKIKAPKYYLSERNKYL